MLRRAFPGVILDVLDCERLSETDLSYLSQISLLLADICMLLLGFLGKGWDILRASPSLLTFHAKSLLCEFIYFLFNLNMHLFCRKLLCFFARRCTQAVLLIQNRRECCTLRSYRPSAIFLIMHTLPALPCFPPMLRLTEPSNNR